MLSEEQQVRQGEIRACIDNIVSFIGDIDFNTYLLDRKTQASVEREFQIISEAAIRLGDDADISIDHLIHIARPKQLYQHSPEPVAAT